MNILFIAYDFSPTSGGVQRVTDLIANGLKCRGHNIFYLCACSANQDIQGKILDFPIFYIDGGPSDIISSNQIDYYKSVLDQNKIDIVINQYPLHTRGDVLFRNTPCKIKKISFYHGKPFGLLNANKRLNRNPFKAFSYLLDRYRLRKRFKKILDLSDCLCLLSEGNVDELRKEIKVDKNKISVICNPNTFSVNLQYNPRNKQNIVLFVGRVGDKVKNVSDFIKTWELLHKSYKNWKALIVGDDSNCSDYKFYIDKHKIQNIEFVGYQRDIIKYYESSKIICLTSHSEGWPMVISEAKSLGCVPCSYSTFGSVYELINSWKSGVIVDAYNVKQMADSISKMMSNPKLLEQMAFNAIRETEDFRVDVVVEKYEILFRKLCKH